MVDSKGKVSKIRLVLNSEFGMFDRWEIHIEMSSFATGDSRSR